MELVKDDRIEKIMWLVEGKVQEGKNGPYWAGKFIIERQAVPAKMWQNRRFEEHARLLVPNNPFMVKAKVDEYNGVKQLIVQDVEPYRGEFDKSDFLPSGTVDRDEMIVEFEAIVSGMDDDDYRKLLIAFRDSRLFEDFSYAPAAKAIHHAWKSGLLEHSLGLARIINSLSPLYPALDRDLLLAGAFLHDAGKVLEISRDPGFDYTVDGRLLGHIYMGAKFAEDLIAGIENFPLVKKRRIMHLILSHQGERSDGFGSPVDPSTVEAVFFHHVDNLDAKVRHCLTEIEKSGESAGFVQTPMPMKITLYLGEKEASLLEEKADAAHKSKPRNKLFEED